MECISAAGDAVPLSFVLLEGPLPDVGDLSDHMIHIRWVSHSGRAMCVLIYICLLMLFHLCFQAHEITN